MSHFDNPTPEIPEAMPATADALLTLIDQPDRALYTAEEFLAAAQSLAEGLVASLLSEIAVKRIQMEVDAYFGLVSGGEYARWTEVIRKAERLVEARMGGAR